MMKTQAIKIETKQGLWVAALYDAADRRGKYPLVLLLHGNPGKKEEKHLATLAEGLAAAGISALRFDAPGLGESEGTWAEDYRVSTYVAAAKDVLEYAVKNLSADPARIGLWSHSMGALVATTLAGNSSGIKAVCECQPTIGQATSLSQEKIKAWCETGWREFHTEYYGTIRLPYAFYLDRGKYNNLEMIKKVKASILLIAGTKDTAVPASDVKALFAAAPDNPKIYREFPIGHFYKRNPKYLAMVNPIVIEFFKAHLA